MGRHSSNLKFTKLVDPRLQSDRPVLDHLAVIIELPVGSTDHESDRKFLTQKKKRKKINNIKSLFIEAQNLRFEIASIVWILKLQPIKQIQIKFLQLRMNIC